MVSAVEAPLATIDGLLVSPSASCSTAQAVTVTNTRTLDHPLTSATLGVSDCTVALLPTPGGWGLRSRGTQSSSPPRGAASPMLPGLR
ncbi:MAG: hypothetical protein ACHREM_06765 [Polyangiales bacterium]